MRWHKGNGTALVWLALSGVSWAQAAPHAEDRVSFVEALRTTLSAHPNVQFQEQQVAINLGRRRQASGRFDTTLTSSFAHTRRNDPLTPYDREQAATVGITAFNLDSNLTLFDAGATKLYRNGISIGPQLTMNRASDNVQNLLGANTASMAFVVTIPLWRGRGRRVVAAEERAAATEVDAATYDLNQTISNLLANTAAAYWTALAGSKNLEVAQGAEQRGRVYVDNVRTLIDAGRVPPAEINQVKANLAGRIAERIAAEQRLVEARQQLALAMGLRPGQMAAIGIPSDEFPVVPAGLLPTVDLELVQQYFEIAVRRRADLLASRQREVAARTRLVAATNATRPGIDINLSPGYSGLSEGAGGLFFQSPFHAIRGVDGVAGITYRFAPSNNLAVGQMIEAKATAKQTELRSAELERNIMAAVASALQAVHNSAQQVVQAHDAVVAFEAALDGEREKFRLGTGSVIDVLTMEDRLTIALRNDVSANLAYAQDLAQLRAATGTIVQPSRAVQSVEPDLFYSPPHIPGSSNP